MALDTVKLWRRRNFAFDLETTTNTPVSLAAAQATTNVFNPKIKYNSEAVEREAQGLSLSPILQYVGARGATAEFETELVGSGGSGVATWVKLLRMCGMDDSGLSGTFVPISNLGKTGCMATWQDGRRKLISGVMGSFKMQLKRAQKGRIMWSMQGVAQPVIDAANPSPTYVTTKAPRIGASAFTLGGVSFKCDEIEIDKGNHVFMREDIDAVDTNGDATGYRSAWIGGWKTIFRLKPESLGLSTYDFYNLYKNTNTAAFACTIGASSNNTFAISAPVLQLVNNPDEGQREELMTDEVEFMAIRNASAGDDDWSLALS